MHCKEVKIVMKYLFESLFLTGLADEEIRIIKRRVGGVDLCLKEKK
ncbi:MAG: hypothetical protein U9R03_03635 [Candidatus Aerophobetes bacterium]|nr:hypothetical protein [Candidatus Aerophobetes bacterium]